MHAEIIAIGTELTTGAKLDTNSQWLSQELSAVGIPVKYHVTVADDLEANLAVVALAAERSDVVLITGGLGPTLDDLTRDVLARLVNRPLVLDEPSLAIIREMFARRNRPMPERNTVQAMFPEGSTILPNPRGTAPGIYLEAPRPGAAPCRIAALPGVPSEMKPMFQAEVLPRIADLGGGRVIRHARIHCFGLGESAFEELLGDVTARGRDPEVGITAHEATITLRIMAEADSIADCQAKIAATHRLIRERIGDYVFGEEDDELQHVIVRRLIAAGKTVAVLESATAGLLGRWLCELPGAERCVRAAMTLLDPESGGTSPTDGRASVADSRSTRAAAEQWRTRMNADFAVCVSAVRPQKPEDPTSPPIAFVAVATPSGAKALEVNLSGDPAIQRSRTAKTALDLLRRQLGE